MTLKPMFLMNSQKLSCILFRVIFLLSDETRGHWGSEVKSYLHIYFKRVYIVTYVLLLICSLFLQLFILLALQYGAWLWNYFTSLTGI